MIRIVDDTAGTSQPVTPRFSEQVPGRGVPCDSYTGRDRPIPAHDLDFSMPQLPVLNNPRPSTSTPVPAPTHPGGLGGISGPGGPILDPARQQLALELNALLASGSGPDGTGGEVRFGIHDRLLYATDASLYQVEPIGVVVPASIEDAERVVRFCSERNAPMLPRGGGTSLAGQCTNRAVVIDLTPCCRRLLSVDAKQRTCVVEPGIGIDELNEQLTRQGTGLFFAPDPATTRQARWRPSHGASSWRSTLAGSRP